MNHSFMRLRATASDHKRLMPKTERAVALLEQQCFDLTRGSGCSECLEEKVEQASLAEEDYAKGGNGYRTW